MPNTLNIIFNYHHHQQPLTVNEYRKMCEEENVRQRISSITKRFEELGCIIAPVFTPMDDSGRVNHEVIPIYMAHLHKHNIGGILGGTTGEAMSLNVEERKAVLEAWINASKPIGTKVIAQIGGAPLPDVRELAKHAEDLQADAIMTLPELYYTPKVVDHLVDYLITVSNAAPTRPIIYYHFPKMTGVEVNIRQLFAMASEKIINFKGAKADLETAEEVADLLADDQRIFIANHHIAPAVLMGHDSSIATVSNMFPKLVQGIEEAVRSGDVAKAKMLQKKLNKLVDAIATQGNFVPSMKTAMELLTGIPVGPSRLPLISLNQNQRTLLEDRLSRLDHAN